MATSVQMFTAINAMLMLPLVGLLLVTYRRLKRLKAAQDKLVNDLSRAGNDWFRVNVSRPDHFARRMKLLPMEGKGVLVKAGDHLRLAATLLNGERLDIRLPANRIQTRWLGNAGLGSANLHWLSLAAEGREWMVCTDTGFNALQSREATADLYRRIAPDQPLPESARTDFALEKNPASRSVLALLALALLYAVVDGLALNPYALLGLGKAQFGMWPLAAIAALVSYPILARRGVPARESSALAGLLSIAVMMVYLPAIKRLDLALAGDAWREMAFVKRSDTRYEAVTPGPPAVRVPRDSAYWKQFAVGEEYTFEVIQGPLGVWQLDPRRYERLAKDYDADRVKAAAP